MENASKALIIAGAILLAILLISLGIMIFGQAQDTVNNSGMSQAELQAFNSRFIKYEGSNKKGSEVKALINEVLTSNADPNNSARQISLSGHTTTSTVLTTKTYTVTLGYDGGRVNTVTITPAATTSTTTPTSTT